MTLPSWEVADLQAMQAAGELYGVPAIDLELIDREESTGSGGGINSEGYGGFFGLGEKQVGAGVLEDASSASFETQARYAAYDFGQALQAVGGNPVAAEQYYQTGKTTGPESSGAKLFAQQFPGSVSQMPTGLAGGAPSGAGKYVASSASNPDPASADPIPGLLGDIGGGIADVLTFPLTAGEDVIGFGVGLIWPLILRVLMVIFFLAVALLLIHHAVTSGSGSSAVNAGKSALGKVAEIGALAA
ncbi:MAG: hypothetical protein WB116_02065 [Candidatus Dormiibacterota bacterium]